MASSRRVQSRLEVRSIDAWPRTGPRLRLRGERRPPRPQRRLWLKLLLAAAIFLVGLVGGALSSPPSQPAALLLSLVRA